MTFTQQLAKQVVGTLSKDADRYTQIHTIREILIATGREFLSTDRETIDDTLDVLFKEYGFKG